MLLLMLKLMQGGSCSCVKVASVPGLYIIQNSVHKTVVLSCKIHILSVKQDLPHESWFTWVIIQRFFVILPCLLHTCANFL